METYKLDLHTHSVLSPDGGLTATQYRHALASGVVDYVAVTDHNTIDFATQLQAELGDRVIVGEEITTSEGEIIGLFLSKAVSPHLSAKETVKRIRAQRGLVYIPHPFETVRDGLSAETLAEIADEVDIIEAHNGRAVFQNFSELAKEWAIQHEVPGAASSDAHGLKGWGRTYSVLTDKPTRRNLVKQLHQATYEARWPGVTGILYPKMNRVMKFLRRV